jgi:acylglycerol lipase
MPSGSQFFFDKARAKDKTLKLHEGHFHDLLSNVGKETVLADIRTWIETHL